MSIAAIGALVSGILSFPAVFLMLGYGAAVSVLAVLLGCVSIAHITHRPMQYSGKWLAILGVVLGVASTLLLLRMLATWETYGGL